MSSFKNAIWNASAAERASELNVIFFWVIFSLLCQSSQEDWCKYLSSMPLWRSGPNTRTLPAILLALSPSKAADMAHMCVLQNQALGVCRGFVPDIQVCGTHGREDLFNATITWNAEELCQCAAGCKAGSFTE